MLGCTKPTVVKHVPRPASQYTDTISGCGPTEGNQIDVAAPLESSDGWFDKWSEGLVETVRRDMNYQQKIVKMQQVGDLTESMVVEQVTKYVQFLRDVANDELDVHSGAAVVVKNVNYQNCELGILTSVHPRS